MHWTNTWIFARIAHVNVNKRPRQQRTCHGEPVHVVEQVDVAEDEDDHQRPASGHPAGRLLIWLLIGRRGALILRTFRLAVRGEERSRVRHRLASRHGRRWREIRLLLTDPLHWPRTGPLPDGRVTKSSFYRWFSPFVSSIAQTGVTWSHVAKHRQLRSEHVFTRLSCL